MVATTERRPAMYSLKIRKIGNSLGVTLPKEALEKMSVSEGDIIFLTDSPEGFKVTPYDETFEKAMEAFGRTRSKFRNAFKELAK
jgi:putative addiction module antidote